MIQGKPEKIAINHDDYHAQHIGTTKKGEQFFLATPFEPAMGSSPGNEYIALFLFDSEGNLLNSQIEQFGSRGTYDEKKRTKRYMSILKDLGKVNFCRIEIKPFSIEKFGIQFGLITREPENENDVWAVELLPGNYMAFFEPWDSGDYDT